jgi:hypothetical protein
MVLQKKEFFTHSKGLVCQNKACVWIRKFILGKKMQKKNAVLLDTKQILCVEIFSYSTQSVALR